VLENARLLVFFAETPVLRPSGAKGLTRRGSMAPVRKQSSNCSSEKENWYNEDEMGLMEGQGANGFVIGPAEYKAILRKQAGSRAWTSFIECICANGTCLDPLVIFKGKIC